MAQSRSTLHLAPTAADTAAAFNARNQVVVYEDSAENKIFHGDNPFRAWRKSRKCSIGKAAVIMRVAPALYESFERGRYVGLRDDHVMRFCHHFNVPPDKLVGRTPMPDALRNILVDRALHEKTARRREAATFAILNYADDARTAIRRERRKYKRYPNGEKIIRFLDMLALEDYDPLFTYLDPQDRMTLAREDFREELAGIKEQVEHPERARLWKQFQDCALRLYGSGKAMEVYNLIGTLSGRGVSQHADITPGWDVFCEEARKAPDVFPAYDWKYPDMVRGIGRRYVNRAEAFDLMLETYHDYRQYNNAQAVAKKQAETCQKQITVFEVWCQGPQAQAIMTHWHNRHEILTALGRDKQKPAKPVALLTGPTPENRPESAKRSPPAP